MKYEVKKKVLELRKYILTEPNKNEKDKDITEIELMDSILSTLESLIESLKKHEEKINNIETMSYYTYDELINEINNSYEFGLNLKKEIIDKICDGNKDFETTHEEIKISEIDYDEDDNVFLLLSAKFDVICEQIEFLNEKLNENKDIKFSNMKLLRKTFEKARDIYDEIDMSNIYQQLEDDDYSENIGDTEGIYEFNGDDEFEELIEDEWKYESMLNYDTSMLDDIYITAFSEIKEPQRLLIGLLYADFFEFHKNNEEFYSEEDEKDKLEIIKYIEDNSLEDAINRFLQQPLLPIFLLDSYIYYNSNYTTDEKLENRLKLKNIGKIDVLKKFNKFIKDDLKDETLYNSFITSINDLIRISTHNIYIELSFLSYDNASDLMIKYLKTDYIPDNIEELIPNELKNMDIKDLKSLQLKFIISDYVSIELENKNTEIEKILNKSNSNEIFNSLKNNDTALKYILTKYIEKIEEIDNIKLDKAQKQKVMKINNLVALDV